MHPCFCMHNSCCWSWKCGLGAMWCTWVYRKIGFAASWAENRVLFHFMEWLCLPVVGYLTLSGLWEQLDMGPEVLGASLCSRVPGSTAWDTLLPLSLWDVPQAGTAHGSWARGLF